MSTATQLIPTRAPNCTLYELEGSLEDLVNAIALAEEPAARELILEEIGHALRKTKEKRDAVVAFLRHCDAQQKFADAEIERIQERKAFIERVHDGLACYLVQLIDQFAPPDRRGIKRMEGNFSSMRIQKNPDSVLITDEQALPVAWKDVMVSMPAHVWEALLQCLDLEERAFFEKQIKKTEFRPNKRAIASELKNGTEIPGADLAFGDLRLVID